MTLPKPLRMTADEFLAWSMDQPEGRYELVSGEVIAMAAERAAHALVKAAAWRALSDAVAAAGLSCQVFPDGMAVRIDEGTVLEPDASVRCGERLEDDAVEFSDPVIVVEVLSPSTRSRDSGAKLADYFRLPSVKHYLLVRTDTRSVIHHSRGDEDVIATRLLAGGELRLSPPGLAVPLAELFRGM